MNRIDGMIPDVAWRRPDDVLEREIDPESGMLATPYCPTTREEVFVAGTEPASVCPLHAGSGEPSPFLLGSSEPVPAPHNGEFQPPPATNGDARQPAPAARRRDRNAIERLLRRIFGQ
jgi:hypothetical protein